MESYFELFILSKCLYLSINGAVNSFSFI